MAHFSTMFSMAPGCMMTLQGFRSPIYRLVLRPSKRVSRTAKVTFMSPFRGLRFSEMCVILGSDLAIMGVMYALETDLFRWRSQVPSWLRRP